MCFLFKVIGYKIGIYERKLCEAEEGEPPMDEQNLLRDPAAPENLSSYVLFIRHMHCIALQI